MFAIAALWVSKTIGRGIANDDVTVIDSMSFPLSLEIPLAGVADAAFAGKQAETRTIIIKDGTQADKMESDGLFSQGFNDVFWIPITPLFVEFFEAGHGWLKKRYPSGPQSWPAPLDFARHIRNAVSHGGRLHIDKDRGQTAGWHHLTIAFSDNTKQAIGPNGFMSPADLLFLMIDAGEALDQIGCPR